MSDQRIVQVEMTVEEMGRISIALDYLVIPNGPGTGDYRWREPEYVALQRKWDRLYKGLHDALSCGVRRVDAPYR